MKAKPWMIQTVFTALLLLLVAGPALAVPVLIDFDDLEDGVVVTNQFPEATFSSEAGFVNLTSAQQLGSSQPNFICTAPVQGSINCTEDTIVDFTTPVSNLTFLEVGDNNAGVNALIDVFVNGVLVDTVEALGDGNPLLPNLVDLSGFFNITRIRIHSITDAAGLGWDDFSFNTGATQVPEPATLLLLSAGAIALAAIGRRRRARG